MAVHASPNGRCHDLIHRMTRDDGLASAAAAVLLLDMSTDRGGHQSPRHPAPSERYIFSWGYNRGPNVFSAHVRCRMGAGAEDTPL